MITKIISKISVWSLLISENLIPQEQYTQLLQWLKEKLSSLLLKQKGFKKQRITSKLTFLWRQRNFKATQSSETNLKQGAHGHQPTAWSVPYSCAQPYITWAVTAMDSCFALIGAHQHGTAVGSNKGETAVHGCH